MPVTSVIDESGQELSTDELPSINEAAPQDSPADEVIQDEAPEEGAQSEGEPEESGEIDVTIGEKKPEQSQDGDGKNWVKDLRERHRQVTRENAELRKQLETLQPVPQAPVLPPKPKLEEFDYDADKFAEATDKWYEIKQKVDEHTKTIAESQRKEQEAWEAKLSTYHAEREKLKPSAKDIDSAHDDVVSTLSKQQQSMLLLLEKPALAVLALHRNQDELKRLAGIKNIAEFAVQIGKLEGKMTVSRKSSAPPPESKVRGVRASGGSDAGMSAREKQLIDQALKSGDITQLSRFRAQQRSASK